MPVRLNSCVFIALVAIAVASATQIGCTGSNPTPTERLEDALKRRDAVKLAQTHPSASPAAAGDPPCPLLRGSMVPSTPPANGGHRVALSWKASAAANSKYSGAVGYCIYRGAPGDPNPGLINSTPLPGTSCVDDLVVNGARYSYVVRAISSTGATSITSNPAPVDIPATGSSKTPASASAPLCRGQVGP